MNQAGIALADCIKKVDKKVYMINIDKINDYAFDRGVQIVAP